MNHIYNKNLFLILFILCFSWISLLGQDSSSDTDSKINTLIINNTNKIITGFDYPEITGPVLSLELETFKPEFPGSDPRKIKNQKFTYDSNGRPIERIDKNHEGKPDLICNFTYNTLGQIISQNLHYPNMDHSLKFSFIYDGLMLKQADGWYRPEYQGIVCKPKLDDKKRLIELTTLFPDGYIAITGNYLGSDRIISEEYFDYTTHKSARKLIYSYDVFGRIKKIIEYDATSRKCKSLIYEYKDHNLIIMEKQFYHSGILTLKHLIETDEYGNKIQEKIILIGKDASEENLILIRRYKIAYREQSKK